MLLKIKVNFFSRKSNFSSIPKIVFIPVSRGIGGTLFELLDLDDFLLAPRFAALGSLAALAPAAPPPAFGGTAVLLAFFLDFDLQIDFVFVKISILTGALEMDKPIGSISGTSENFLK